MTAERACPQCGDTSARSSERCTRCGADLTSAPAPDIEGYEILERLGEGGMGAVFLARDEVLNRKVAIKVVSRRIAGDPQARERFLREARTLATVEHANVVRVYSFGELGENAYLVLEYVEGETLADRILRDGPLSPDDALGILRQIVLALEAAHEHGIVHRDIKPSNVLLGRRGVVRVADFGLAKPTRVDESVDAITQTGYMLGTPHYVSPEQALGKEVDFRTDIYSLGIVLYEMLTAERPFNGTTPMAVIAKSLNEPMPDIRTKRPDLPRRIVELVNWMTAKDASRRPGSYAELLGVIEQEGRTTIPIQTGLPLQKATWVLGAAIALGLVAGLVVPVPDKSRPQETEPHVSDGTTIAVCPFWGPDEISSREGRVMATLVERSIEERLGADVTVLGIDRTGDAIRSDEDARALGRKLDAGIVVWGESITLRDETEVLPSFTLLGTKRHRLEVERPNEMPTFTRVDVEDLAPERDAEPLRLSSAAPDQIQMRRMSADGVGDMVTFLAGLHSLHANDDASRALAFFERSTPTAEILRHQAEALIRLERTDEAIELLRQAIEMDPEHEESHARLADLLWTRGDSSEAIEHYRAASEGASVPISLHGIIHDGHFFARELWENDRAEIGDSGYLLIVDPATGHVLERHFMPGPIESFESGSKGLVIHWKPRHSSVQNLVWNEGRFDRPIYPGGNFLRRMHAVKSGMEVGRNFIQGAYGILSEQEAHPRYALPDDEDSINDRKPASYEDLEAFLLPAIERDPTQPWYPFHLGWVQKMTGREQAAIETWRGLVEREWPGVPYSEFAWMARLFERLGEPEWADRTFDVAVAAREKNPQQVEWSLLIDRLIVAPVCRMPEADIDDPERAYHWLQRARELTGNTEGERVVSAVWEEWFTREGQASLAAEEAAYQSELFDYTDRATRTDYLIYTLVALVVTFVCVSLFLLAGGWRRARRSGIEPSPVSPMLIALVLAVATTLFVYSLREEPSSFLLLQTGIFWAVLISQVLFARRRTSSWKLPRNAILRSLAWSCLPGLLLLMVGVLHTTPVVLVVAWIVLLTTDVILTISKTSWTGVVSGITKVERMTALTIAILLSCTSWVLISKIAQQSRTASIPVAMVDSLGHPDVIRFLDDAAQERPNDELQYATAVAHHLYGDFARARGLYSIVRDDERAQKAIAAIDEGRIEVTAPQGEELFAGLRDIPLPTLYESMDSKMQRVVKALLWLSVSSLVFCSLLFVAAVGTGSRDKPPGRLWKVVGLVVPSFWWLRSGRARRGVVTLLIFTFVLTTTLTLTRTTRSRSDDHPAPGPFSSAAAPAWETAPYPVPGDLTRADIPRLYRGAIFFAHPGARLFAVVVALSFLALLGLHALTVLDILKASEQGSIHEAETALTPPSPEETPTTPVGESEVGETDATAIKPR